MRILWFVLLVLGIGSCLAGEAWTAVPTSGIESYGEVVSDDELADMRGKFIRPDNISYFGIEMLTSWQGQDGVTTQARLIVSLDFAAGTAAAGEVVPQVLVSWSRDGDSALDVAGALAGFATIPVGGLDSVHGFVQHQQIAGDDNAVRNDMNVAILPGASAAFDTEGMTLVTSPTSVQFADGDTLQVQMGDNQLGILLTEGSDAVRQIVNGNLNQLAQNVIINSDFNDISNRMNTVIGIDPSIEAAQMNVQHAMNGVSGFGF